MNHLIEIKEQLNRYFEGNSSDADEQRLREYFTSGNVTEDLMPYRSIFACLHREKENPKEIICPVIPIQRNKRAKIWYAAAGIAAGLFIAAILHFDKHPSPTETCIGTYVIIDGICYNDLSLVSKYATETIDRVTKPLEGNAAVSALDFLDEK